MYRVELLPGVTDLRNNRTEEGTVLTFSTGAPRPQTTLEGQVLDWSTSRPAPSALVIASLLPDSLPYRGVADSSGRFSLGPLPQGDYIVSGVLDQNNDHRQDPREAYGTARVARGKSAVGELWAFVHDTTAPRIQTVAVDDSVKATVTFTQKLDPRQRLGARDVILRLLPDSTPVAVSSILPQPVDDSIHGTRAPAEDSIAVGDSTVADSSQLNQRVQEAQQAVFDLRSEKEQAENASNLSQIKRSGLTDRLESSRANLGELEMQLHELSSQVDTGAHDKEEQLTLLGSSDAVFQDRNRELAVVEGELTKIEQELQQTKFQLLQFESNVARLRTDCSSYEVDQKTSAHRHESVAGELEQLRQQQSAAAQQLSELTARVEEATVTKARAHQETQDVQIQIGDLTKEFREAQKKLQDIDRQLAQRTARLNLLKQLAEKFEGFGEGAKAILQGRLATTLGETSATPITKGLEIAPAHAKAVEALLGSAVEAINVADVATAQRIIAQLETEQIGAAVLQVSGLAPQSVSADSLPAGLTPATASLVNFDPAHPAAALLGACYVAENLNAFLDFWRDNPSFSFLAVATAKGEIVDRRGLVFGGYAKKSNNSIVQREIDLRETARLLADDQKAHDDQKAVIDSLNSRLAEAEVTLEAKRAEVLEASQNVATVQSEERNAQRSLEEIGTKANRMESELQGLEAQRNETQSRFERAQAALTEAATSVESGRVRIHEMETRLTELRTDRDVKRDTLAQARLELADARQKVEVLDRGIADMERRRRQLSEILVQRQQEVEVWTEQIASLESESDNQKARAAQIAETLVVAQQQVESIRKELTDVEREIGGVENSQEGIRTDAEKAQSDFSRCEVALAQNKSRAQFIEEDVQREFQIRVGQYDWRALLWRSEDDPPDLKELDLDDDEDDAAPAPVAAVVEAAPAVEGETAETPTAEAAAAPKRRKKKGPKPDPTEEDLVELEKSAAWGEIKAELDALRQRLAGMGAVNTGAIEEYAELKQRYDFLKGQSDDLNTAKADLVTTIDEINRTSMEQFQITFDQIKKNFIYTFQTLYGGGIANLELIVTDDILESGIEITAQPPGTKLKGITLLSGGQKTLTAVALLFALYMVKPSPFCLLDELDAPLDESNIGRFTNLLGKFVDNSQFIIITHNKRTVSAAQAIYGVTMEERGVSKTVSMKFNQHKDDIEKTENIAESVRGAKSTLTA
ncbi:MAG: chromosome segregation protein SMC [Opitutaceae bacterium]|nr:chromosome segregation protein SMC [Opitutaceae bacterium]